MRILVRYLAAIDERKHGWMAKEEIERYRATLRRRYVPGIRETH